MMADSGRKTKLQIINRLWEHIHDLLNYIQGYKGKGLEEIEREIDLSEYYCRPYCDCDDDELYAADVARAAKTILEEKEGRRQEWIS